MSTIVAGETYILLSRLETALLRWQLFREHVAILEATVERTLFRIYDNLDALLHRIRNEADALEKRRQGVGCVYVVFGKSGTVTVYHTEYEQMGDNIEWQEGVGLKLMTIEEFEQVVFLLQRDVIGGDWTAAVTLLNMNRTIW